MKTQKYLFFILLISFSFLQHNYSQVLQLRGKVSDRLNNAPLSGASIYFANSSFGTVSDSNGFFTIDIPESKSDLLISYVGYKDVITPAEVYLISPEMNIFLDIDFLSFADGVVIVGSTSGKRSNLSSSVPVDQFSTVLLEQTGQVDLSQQINTLAPSFYSTRLTYSDATDHMDPAALRGLNPDQTLVLVNGKRHHPSAIVNTLGTVSRGSVINDLNTIPASAISRVEILRDGASSQYGSDAIAGVINIVLKENTNKLSIKSQIGQYYEGDGFQSQLSANYGNKLFKNGFINFSAELRNRAATNRAGIYQGLIYRTASQDGLTLQENIDLDNQNIVDRGLDRSDFRMKLGNSAMTDASFYLNSEMPLSDNFDFYLFGGANIRNSISAADFRLPNDGNRSNLILYPDGFIPEIQAKLNDEFLSSGIKGDLLGWNTDLSYAFGRNEIDFFVNNSANASMGATSPKDFKSGGISFNQSIINLDLNRDFASLVNWKQFQLNIGSEYRIENYQIIQGEENSWINQNQTSYPGAQGYPGYQPSDAVDASRTNLSLFAGLNLQPVQSLLIEIGGRYENYSDFGDNLTGKISSRYSLTNWLNLRGSASTGFRAPSLHQSFYNYTGSYYGGGFLYEILTARNNNPATAAFGIPGLKDETSSNFSLGLSAKPAKNTNFTLDFYQIDVKDRIVLSGTFYKYFGNDAVDSLLSSLPTTGAVQFFTNAVDTRTRGFDFIASHEISLSNGLIGASFGLNYSETNIVGDIHSSEAISENGLTDMFFDRQSKALIESAQPRLKYSLGLNYLYKNLSGVIRNTYYGQVSYLGAYNTAEDQTYAGKWITDVKLSYKFKKSIALSVGANNLFNIYPDKNNSTLQNQGRFIYNTAVTQFGFNGGYYFVGLSLDI